MFSAISGAIRQMKRILSRVLKRKCELNWLARRFTCSSATISASSLFSSICRFRLRIIWLNPLPIFLNSVLLWISRCALRSPSVTARNASFSVDISSVAFTAIFSVLDRPAKNRKASTTIPVNSTMASTRTVSV